LLNDKDRVFVVGCAPGRSLPSTIALVFNACCRVCCLQAD